VKNENTKGDKLKIIKALIAACLLISLQDLGWASGLDEELTKAEAEKKFVMLELGSVGCIPCEQMRPVMDRLSRNYKGKLEVIFVDIRKDSEPARRFRVFGIPTQVFLDRNGKEFHRHVGYYDYGSIVPVLKKAGI